MSTGAFLARMGIAKLGKLGDSITSAIVAFDPATASQVQIDQMAAHCQELAGRVSQAETEEERLHGNVTRLEKQLSDTATAARIIGDQITAGKGDANVLNKQLNTLMDTIEKIGGPETDGTTAGTLFEARQDHAQAESDMHEWQTVHAGAVESLTTARKRLETAQHDMERAQQQEQREKERQAQTERDAGLKSGLDGNNVALSAMEQAAQKAKERARAAQINTQAIKDSTGVGAGNADDIVKQTLAGANTAAPTSAMDRLARLKAA